MLLKTIIIIAVLLLLFTGVCHANESESEQIVPEIHDSEKSLDITLPEITEHTKCQVLEVSLLGNNTVFYLEKDLDSFYLRYVFLGNDVYAFGKIKNDKWEVTETNNDFVSLTISEIIPKIDDLSWQLVTPKTDRTGRTQIQDYTMIQVSIDNRIYDVHVYDYGDHYTFTLFGDDVIGDTLASGTIDSQGAWKSTSFSSGFNKDGKWSSFDNINARADEITEIINKTYLEEVNRIGG